MRARSHSSVQFPAANVAQDSRTFPSLLLSKCQSPDTLLHGFVQVIMIGPGTGVAPFRGFIQERVALAKKAKEADGPDALKDWGDIILFYGCRQAKTDYLYVSPTPIHAAMSLTIWVGF